jgi:hypothetical protein
MTLSGTVWRVPVAPGNYLRLQVSAAHLFLTMFSALHAPHFACLSRSDARCVQTTRA